MKRGSRPGERDVYDGVVSRAPLCRHWRIAWQCDLTIVLFLKGFELGSPSTEVFPNVIVGGSANLGVIWDRFTGGMSKGEKTVQVSLWSQERTIRDRGRQ